ncbi:Hpt domain-containing protein [Parendozoicomonas haliclonae]|uniref:Hpt domain protein n=1 Tax=Parendozoicomonas haliclonae TaxID=1960125 RepID=A0A1X7ANY5_9GAMM|nr:Hpt domain-containing protein [Parendozoicomonas haliclonae]SMA49996.1 Hpt domain protein [Parendozoicomonas haliclonae]
MLNLESLHEMVGNDPDMVKELLGQFIETTQDDMRNLQDAIAAGNTRDVAGLAHRIKGSCFVVGASQLAEFADLLERDGREDNASRFDDLSSKIAAEFQQVLNAIDKLR